MSADDGSTVVGQDLQPMGGPAESGLSKRLREQEEQVEKELKEEEE